MYFFGFQRLFSGEVVGKYERRTRQSGKPVGVDGVADEVNVRKRSLVAGPIQPEADRQGIQSADHAELATRQVVIGPRRGRVDDFDGITEFRHDFV